MTREGRRDHHRRRRDRSVDRVRALPSAGYKTLNIDKLPAAGLRADEQLVLDRARPLLLARRRGDGPRGLLLLAGLAALPRRSATSRAWRKYMHSGTVLLGSGTGHHEKVLKHYRDLGVEHELWDNDELRRRIPIYDTARVLAAQAPGRPALLGPVRAASSTARSTRPARATSTTRSWPRTTSSAPPRRTAASSCSAREVGRDPPRQRPRQRASRSTDGHRDRRAGRRQRRRPALVRDQPHGRRRGRR